MSYIGFAIWLIIASIAMYWAIRVEKLKKNYDIQTYKEIVAFYEGKNLDEIEKNREYGKRSYQKFLLAVSFGLIAGIIAFALGYIFY